LSLLVVAQAFQGTLRGGFKRTPIVFYHQPYPIRINSVVFMGRNKFPRARTFDHGIVGQSSSASSPSFLAASLIRSKQRSVALRVLRSSRKLFAFIPLVNSSTRMIFSRISSKRCMGSLEGTNDLGLDVFPHPRLQRPFLDKFDGMAKHLRDLLLDSRDIQERYATRIVEGSQKIISESGRRSPRAVEPNSDRRTTPAARSSRSCSRNVAITCSLFNVPILAVRSSAGQACVMPVCRGHRTRKPVTTLM
jgi:hypothetical protein